MIVLSEYPTIATAAGYDQAVAGSRETAEMCRALLIAIMIAERAAAADPEIEPALRRFFSPMNDLFGDLFETLAARDAAIETYTALRAPIPQTGDVK